jgi:hypothetical protein
MTIGGWFMLIISVTTVCTLFTWCIYKVMTIPEETDHLHGFNASESEQAEAKKIKS